MILSFDFISFISNKQSTMISIITEKLCNERSPTEVSRGKAFLAFQVIPYTGTGSWKSNLSPWCRYMSLTDGHWHNFGIVDQQRFSSSCLDLSFSCCNARDRKNMRMNGDQRCFPLQVTDAWSTGPIRLGRVDHRLELHPVYTTIPITISNVKHLLNIWVADLREDCSWNFH